MKNIFTRLILFITVAQALTACSNAKSDWLVNPPAKDQSFSENEDLTFDLAPKAEILFVIDNSGSMREHIKRVSENIDKFVDAFADNNPLEYNFAVTSVYDSRTFDSGRYAESRRAANNFYQLGQFRTGVDGHEASVSADGASHLNKPFLSSSDENLKDHLRRALKVGVQEWNRGGPQYEESFSPVAALYNLAGYSLTPELLAAQKYFFLGEKSYKILFFVTDANDASHMSASEFYQGLVNKAANGDADKIMAFGAIVPSDSKTCVRDPGTRSFKLEELLNLTRKGYEESNIVSLCEDFGEKLAIFGRSVRTRTLAKNIPLKNGVPVINGDPDETLRVFYGRQEIPPEINADVIGYRYNPETNSVWLNPNFKYDVKSGAKLCVQYTALSSRGTSTGLGAKHKCQ